MTYLELHPPARSQYVRPRRARLTGGIAVHTAENTTDLVLPDEGAEGVARFISTRSDAGSYHTVVDSDTIVRVIPYDWEAFHDGTGGNRWSLGLSFACRAAQWPALPAIWRAGALRNAAAEAQAMAAHVFLKTGITVPARRITAAQYRAGAAGFVGHGELDPTRRSDPGPAFPWDAFLSLYANANTSTPEVPAMPTTPASDAMVEQWQRQLLANGAQLGGGADGLFGRLTLEASTTVLNHRNQLLAQVAKLQKSLDENVQANLLLYGDLQKAEAEVGRLQSLADVATKGPALLAIVRQLGGHVDEAVAKLQGLA